MQLFDKGDDDQLCEANGFRKGRAINDAPHICDQQTNKKPGNILAIEARGCRSDEARG